MSRERCTPEYTIVKDENMPAWSANVHVQWPLMVVEENPELLDAIEELVEGNQLRKLEDGSYQEFSHGMARGKITPFESKTGVPMLKMDASILLELLHEIDQNHQFILFEDELIARREMHKRMDAYGADQIGVE